MILKCLCYPDRILDWREYVVIQIRHNEGKQRWLFCDIERNEPSGLLPMNGKVYRRGTAEGIVLDDPIEGEQRAIEARTVREIKVPYDHGVDEWDVLHVSPEDVATMLRFCQQTGWRCCEAQESFWSLWEGGGPITTSVVLREAHEALLLGMTQASGAR